MFDAEGHDASEEPLAIPVIEKAAQLPRLRCAVSIRSNARPGLFVVVYNEDLILFHERSSMDQRARREDGPESVETGHSVRPEVVPVLEVLIKLGVAGPLLQSLKHALQVRSCEGVDFIGPGFLSCLFKQIPIQNDLFVGSKEGITV